MFRCSEGEKGHSDTLLLHLHMCPSAGGARTPVAACFVDWRRCSPELISNSQKHALIYVYTSMRCSFACRCEIKIDVNKIGVVFKEIRPRATRLIIFMGGCKTIFFSAPLKSNVDVAYLMWWRVLHCGRAGDTGRRREKNLFVQGCKFLFRRFKPNL